MSKRTLSFFAWLLVLFELATYLSNDLYTPALPKIADAFRVSIADTQLTLTSFFMGMSSLQLILGPLSDRFGRRLPLLVGIWLFVFSTLACALSPTIHILIVARFFQGCVICFVSTVGYSSIHESNGQKKAIHILAIMAGISMLAPTFGPLLGSILMQWFSWRWLFGILVFFGLLLALFLGRYMTETLPAHKRHRSSFRVLSQQYGRILRNPLFLSNAVITFCLILGLMTWIVAGPFIVMIAFKQSMFVFSATQICIFGGMALSTATVKYVLEWLQVDRLIHWGISLALCASAFGLSSALYFPHALWLFVGAFTVFNFGALWGISGAQRLSIEASQEPMGMRMAIFSTGNSASGIVSSLLAVTTYNGTLQWFGWVLLGTSLVAAFAHYVKRFIVVRAPLDELPKTD